MNEHSNNIFERGQIADVGSKGINVLSLFNGMSTGHTALDNVGIKVNKYYSSELKPYAIELTQYHYPETIQLGDVNNWREWDIDWKSIDLLLSGSPCKDLSIAGKRKGINGSNSGLFWKFIEIYEHIKSLNPNVIFFQENVGSAPKEDIGIMSRAMGVYPVRFNSSLVTAQLRDRYYWTNAKTKPFGMFGDLVTDIPEPKDKGIKFKDIIEDGFTNREKANCLLQSDVKHLINNEVKQQIYIEKRGAKGKQTPNIIYLDEGVLKVKTNTKKGYDVMTEDDCLNLSFPSSTTRRGRVTKGKAPCLLQGNEPLYTWNGATLRTLTKVELCRLQGFPDNHCDILSRNKAASLLGDGWTLPIIEHIFQYLPFKKAREEKNVITEYNNEPLNKTGT